MLLASEQKVSFVCVNRFFVGRP